MDHPQALAAAGLAGPVQRFARIEQAGKPGAALLLAAKAQQLTGRPQSPPPSSPGSAGRNVYGVLVAQGAADLFATDCTNTALAVQAQPGQRSVLLPDTVNVSASDGVTVLGEAPSAAPTPAAADGAAFVGFLLSPVGQAVLAQHGFAPR